ncbi:MAG: hypothetical protein L3K03_06535 [Thermoplasmata archaeon]|nr:hypothetical protein [Thermoplasmata archaeon]
MSTNDPTTSITVHTSTLRLLQERKKGNETWDDFLLDVIPKGRPVRFFMNDEDRDGLDRGRLTPRMEEEMDRRRSEALPSVPAEKVYRRARLSP